MKTALQELIEWLEKSSDIENDILNWELVKENALEKEKEQIIAAGNFLPHDEQNEIKTPEEYYNQTYNN